MIKITTIEDAKKYFEIPNEAIEFLKEANCDTESKRYDFGEFCYVNVREFDTKIDTPLMESHEKYADIQYLISGDEKIYYTSKEGLRIKKPCSEGGDTTLYDFDGKSEAVTYTSGEAVILYPEDAHLPNRAVEEPNTIKKAVIKVSMTKKK